MNAHVVTLTREERCASCRDPQPQGQEMTEVDGRKLCATCLPWAEIEP